MVFIQVRARWPNRSLTASPALDLTFIDSHKLSLFYMNCKEKQFQRRGGGIGNFLAAVWSSFVVKLGRRVKIEAVKTKDLYKMCFMAMRYLKQTNKKPQHIQGARLDFSFAAWSL